MAALEILKHLPVRYLPAAETGGFLNPVSWVAGLAIGFLANRRTPRQYPCWIWTIGMVWLVYGIFDAAHGYNPIFYQGCSLRQNIVNAFFILDSHKCGGGSSTLEGLFFTFPALNSAAYREGLW